MQKLRGEESTYTQIHLIINLYHAWALASCEQWQCDKYSKTEKSGYNRRERGGGIFH